MELLLSICIPTYNRDWCVKEQIERIKKCPEEIKSLVEFIICDNCSTDNTQIVANHAICPDLNINYHYYKNNENLGMDGNFIKCFNVANGKYVWLLGDDDFLNIFMLPALMRILKSNKYGLIHIMPNNENIQKYYEEIFDKWEFLNAVGYNISFISTNIFKKSFVEDSDIVWNDYQGTLFSQLPMYIASWYKSDVNVLVYLPLIEAYKDAVNNGGYNFFQTWVCDYLYVWKKFVKYGFITRYSYRWIKFNLWTFVFEYTKRLLIRKDVGNFKTANGWNILFKQYGNEWYFWWSWIKYPFAVLKRKFIKSI